MRLSDIEVGKDYYFDPHWDWEKVPYGQRVTVRGKGYKPAHTYKSGEQPPQPVAGGTHVLVDLYDGRPHAAPERRIVPAAHLRGPWKETVERVKALRAQEKAAQERADEEWRAKRDAELKAEYGEWQRQVDRAVEVERRARELLGAEVGRDVSQRRIVLDPETVTTLLDAWVQVRGEPVRATR